MGQICCVRGRVCAIGAGALVDRGAEAFNGSRVGGTAASAGGGDAAAGGRGDAAAAGALRSFRFAGEGADRGRGAGVGGTAGSNCAGGGDHGLDGADADSAREHARPAAGADCAVERAAGDEPAAPDRVNAREDSAGWNAGRRCFARTAADSAGDGATATGD